MLPQHKKNSIGMVSDAIIEHLTNRFTVSVQSSTVVGPPAEWPRSPANVQDNVRKWPRRASSLPEYGLVCADMVRT